MTDVIHCIPPESGIVCVDHRLGMIFSLLLIWLERLRSLERTEVGFIHSDDDDDDE